MRSFFREFKKAFKEELKVAPIGITMAGSVLTGIALIFGTIEFNDPIVPTWLARNIFRLIGLVFVSSPFIALWQARGEE